MHKTISVSITPIDLIRFDAYCAAHGGLPRGKAIALMLDELAQGTYVAPVERHPDLGPEPQRYPFGTTAPEPTGERVVEPLPPWEV